MMNEWHMEEPALENTEEEKRAGDLPVQAAGPEKDKTGRPEDKAAGPEKDKTGRPEDKAAGPVKNQAQGARLMWQLYWAWFRMGLFTFGGGYAMLPMIQKEVIDHYHWADEEEVLDYYAVGQCTPGAIAVNTATFIGYKVGGTAGGIISTLGVVTPSLLIISVIAALLQNFADYPVVQNALAGIRVAVCVLMFVSVEKLLKSGVKDLPSWIILGAAFVLSYFTKISTVILVILAGAAGCVLSSMRKHRKPETYSSHNGPDRDARAGVGKTSGTHVPEKGENQFSGEEEHR